MAISDGERRARERKAVARTARAATGMELSEARSYIASIIASIRKTQDLLNAGVKLDWGYADKARHLAEQLREIVEGDTDE